VSTPEALRGQDQKKHVWRSGQWFSAKRFGVTSGIGACALRLTNTIGPHMRVKDSRQTFLGTWTRLLVEGKPFEVWGGEQLRDFTYVDDAVEALLDVAACENTNSRVFNLGGECVISLKELADLCVDVNGGGEYVVRSYPLDRVPIDIGDYYADFRLIHSTLGWEPKTSLREGLSRTLEFYRKHLDKYL
jgi:UDP-glucose 4-epimerase